jgi:tetratricopeptide (TPR) repeat protein
LAATPVTGTFNVNINAVAPFLSAATLAELRTLDARETTANDARIAAGLSPLAGAAPGVVSTAIQRRVEETGSRNSLDERNAFRVLAGFTGGITDSLNYDAYYSYARTRNANVQAGNISRSAFQRGLDGTGDPINIFGYNTLTPEMVDGISIDAQNGDISTVQVANGTVSGFFGDFGWGGGEIGFAAGAEYRRVAAEFIPDTALSSGDVIGFNAGDPTEGAYSVKELFAEINVPIFETDGGQRLELTGAARFSDYSLDNVGSVWTYAGGAKFTVIDGVMLRGQYQRAVRAPNVGELAAPIRTGLANATFDPCSVTNATGLGEALREAGRLPEAEQFTREAIRLSNGARGDVWATLALILDEQGRAADSATALAKALEIDPKLADPDTKVKSLAMDRAMAEDLKRLLSTTKVGWPEQEKTAY